MALLINKLYTDIYWLLNTWFIFLQLRTVHGLLFAMGNTQHADSQRQAGIALQVSVMPSPGRLCFPHIFHFTHAALCLSLDLLARKSFATFENRKLVLCTTGTTYNAKDFEKVQPRLSYYSDYHNATIVVTRRIVTMYRGNYMHARRSFNQSGVANQESRKVLPVSSWGKHVLAKFAIGLDWFRELYVCF